MGKNKQRNVSFSQLMNSVDESVKAKETQIIPEKKVEEPVVHPSVNMVEPEPEETPEVPEGMTVTNDQEGQKVARNIADTAFKTFKTPAERLKEEAAATPTMSSVNANLSADAKKVAQYIKDYLDFNNGNIMRSENDKIVAGRKFRDILFYGLDHPTTDVLDQIYKFFLKNKNRILAPEIALPNTLTFDKVTCERINCLYTLFRSLTEERPFRLNVANTRLLLKSVDSTKVDALLMYFDNKQKK